MSPFSGASLQTSEAGELAAVELHGWFVYLLALSDCSAFKVGFTCNPLQRIDGFSRRYFERFDLQQSWLLNLEQCAAARDIETRLKRASSAFRCEAPAWLPDAAGGHTEWFRAVQFTDAGRLLESCTAQYSDACCMNAFELLRTQLTHRCSELELWARQSAAGLWQQPASTRSTAKLANTLRDWLDACRYCEVPLFSDDPDTLRSVLAAIHHGRGDSGL